jgi:hypothetical protein
LLTFIFEKVVIRFTFNIMNRIIYAKSSVLQNLEASFTITLQGVAQSKDRQYNCLDSDTSIVYHCNSTQHNLYHFYITHINLIIVDQLIILSYLDRTIIFVTNKRK